MNEHIKELAERAFESAHRENGDMPMMLQKFAELIVRECMDIAEETALGESTYGWMVSQNIASKMGIE